MAWLLTIVWLPVATALSGRTEGEDRLIKVVYIGSLILTSVISLIQRLYLRRHADLHDLSPAVLQGGLVAEIAMSVLFSIALIVAVVFPRIGYLSLLLMFLMGPTQSIVTRLMPVARASGQESAEQ